MKPKSKARALLDTSRGSLNRLRKKAEFYKLDKFIIDEMYRIEAMLHDVSLEIINLEAHPHKAVAP